jgi:hypothetical protein
MTQDLMSAVAGDAVEQAKASAQKLLGPVVVANVFDAVTNTANAASNQQNLITTFEALMNKLGVLVKIGDEVAKVCSSLSSLIARPKLVFLLLKNTDSPVYQFCVAGAVRRNEG